MRRASRASEETLSASLLEHELARTKRHAAANIGTSRTTLVETLREKCASFGSEPTSSTVTAISSLEVVKANTARAFDILTDMQRCATFYARKLASDGGTEADSMLPARVANCLHTWTLFIPKLACLPHAHLSGVLVRLPSILTTLSCTAEMQRSNAVLAMAQEALRLLRDASCRLEREVKERCLPLCSLLPPWTVLVTCAQYRWTWDQISDLLLRQVAPSLSADAATTTASAEAELTKARNEVRFHELQEMVELAHADQFARDVLLFSFESINWTVGSAVATIQSVAPIVFCLFLRCRSLALYGLNRLDDSARPTYFEAMCARRLVARVLQCAIDSLRACLAHNATDMHPDRVRQLTTHDIPSLVLLTRLWYSFLQPCPSLSTAVHASLVRLVNTAVELRDPLTVDEANLMVDAESSEAADAHGDGDGPRSSSARREEEAPRAAAFLDVVWNVKPLQEDEIVLDGAGLPWGESFPRAAAMRSVLNESVSVTTVE